MRSEGSKRLAGVDKTQREIASRIGVTQATVARWISGQKTPNLDHRRAMYLAFRIPVASWPDQWTIVRDIVVETLAAEAPDLLEKIIRQIETIEDD
jgi:transcriptional regulator with XRE-family HTH domain